MTAFCVIDSFFIASPGFAVPDSEETSQGYELNNAASNVKGFSLFMDLIELQTDVADVYYQLFALLLGYPITGSYHTFKYLLVFIYVTDVNTQFIGCQRRCAFRFILMIFFFSSLFVNFQMKVFDLMTSVFLFQSYQQDCLSHWRTST